MKEQKIRIPVAFGIIVVMFFVLILVNILKPTQFVLVILSLSTGTILWLKFELFLYRKRTGKVQLEEVVLARMYQSNYIGKFYRNIILLMIPVIIFSYFFVKVNIIDRDYTQRMRHNLDVSIEILKADEFGMNIANLYNDPLVNLVIKEGYNSQFVITSALCIDSAANVAKTLGVYSYVRRSMESEEPLSTDVEEVITIIKETNANIDNVYGSLQLDEKEPTPTESLIINLRDLNYGFRAINSKLSESLIKEETKLDSYKQALEILETTLSMSRDKLTENIDTLLTVEKNRVIRDALLFRIAWLGAFFSVARIIGIINYYRRVKKYRKGL